MFRCWAENWVALVCVDGEAAVGRDEDSYSIQRKKLSMITIIK